PLGLVGLLPWTPLLPLALVPLRDRPRSAAAALAAAWVATGVVFFSLAAAKRSVYLLPLHPGVALLLGAGVAAPPAHGRLERLASLGALLFAPAGLGLAALGGACRASSPTCRAASRPARHSTRSTRPTPGSASTRRQRCASGRTRERPPAHRSSSGRTSGSGCATRTARPSPCSR